MKHKKGYCKQHNLPLVPVWIGTDLVAICPKCRGEGSIETSPVVVEPCNQCLGTGKVDLTQQTQAVLEFARLMIDKLELRNKRRNQGPLLGRQKDHSTWHYFMRLKEEAEELGNAIVLHNALRTKTTADEVISECCDVANFAAAVAEKVLEDKGKKIDED